MGKQYTQKEAEEVINLRSNGRFRLIGEYLHSREYHNFEHLDCGRTTSKRWADFIDSFNEGSIHSNCSHCN